MSAPFPFRLAAALSTVAALAVAPARAEGPLADAGGAPARADLTPAHVLAGVSGGVLLVHAGYAGGARGNAGAHGGVITTTWRWHQLALAITAHPVTVDGDRDLFGLFSAGAAVPVSGRWILLADGLGGFVTGTERTPLRPALGLRLGVERVSRLGLLGVKVVALTATVVGDVGGSADADAAGRVTGIAALTFGIPLPAR